MELLSTGIPELDEALGGGLLADSNLLIVYDTYSTGGLLGVEILRKRVRMGDFGLLLSTVLPPTPLSMELKRINFDLEEEGKKGNVAVLDIFSSMHKIHYQSEFIYTDPTMDASTFLPKYTSLYRRILKEKMGDRRPVGVDVTVDGLAFLFGEDTAIRIFQTLMALKEKARVEEHRKRPINILLLNKGRTSERLIAWMALYSQYVIEFCSSMESIEEKMIVRKSPLPDFKPREGGYRFRIEGGQIVIE
ncbi:ATPase domain-containing protein [Thermococcus sp.]|uniref:RAD55 family ATPase n=1 Tax=Thermococcus sp. TaxID=35749 RepID=UPI002623E0C4|nr:ATPase domain-containing protein [Thermococcus sp.]